MGYKIYRVEFLSNRIYLLNDKLTINEIIQSIKEFNIDCDHNFDDDGNTVKVILYCYSKVINKLHFFIKVHNHLDINECIEDLKSDIYQSFTLSPWEIRLNMIDILKTTLIKEVNLDYCTKVLDSNKLKSINTYTDEDVESFLYETGLEYSRILTRELLYLQVQLHNTFHLFKEKDIELAKTEFNSKYHRLKQIVDENGNYLPKLIGIAYKFAKLFKEMHMKCELNQLANEVIIRLNNVHQVSYILYWKEVFKRFINK